MTTWGPWRLVRWWPLHFAGVWLLIGMGLHNVALADTPALVLNDYLRNYSLVSHLDYLEDAHNSLDYDAANQAFREGRGQRFAGDAINLGFSDHSFWFRFVLHNPLPRQRSVILQISTLR